MPGWAASQPLQQRDVAEHVDAGHGEGLVGGRDDQGSGALARGAQHPLPDVGAGQVHGGHPGAPAQQRGQRAHLGARAEDGDGASLEAQPLGVLHHEAHGRGQARLDDAALDPRVDLPQQRAAAQPLPPVGQDQLALRLPLTDHLELPQAPRPGVPVGQRALLAVVGDDAHPLVEAVQARPGHRQRRRRVVEADLDQAPEVDEVVRAPGGLGGRGPGAGRIDGLERLRHHGAAQRGGAATSGVVGGQDQAARCGRVGAHGAILPHPALGRLPRRRRPRRAGPSRSPQPGTPAADDLSRDHAGSPRHRPEDREIPFRLVTRSDVDGLVCAALLTELGLIDDISFVHPQDVQDGRVEITERDITTNLPWVPGAHLVFDHHLSETVRTAPTRTT